MVLKRLTILCIGLILATLLIASNAFCGTDDSGLQVFTLNGADMMGETADVGQEDTKISQYCYNMFQSGNGISSVPRLQGSGYEWDGVIEQINTMLYSFVKLSTAGGSLSSEVYIHSNVLYPSPTGSRTLIAKDIYNISAGDLFQFSGLSKDYLFTGNKLLSSTTGFATTAEVTIPAVGRTGTIWQNRFWYATNNYTIYYTAAQDFENFTNSATAGGTINIVGARGIQRIIGTKYGLYIFSSVGTFLLSGASKAWTIEKINDLYLNNGFNLCVYNDVIYFASANVNGLKIYQLEANSLSVLCDVPSLAVRCSQINVYNSGRLLVLSSLLTNTLSWIYDIKNKSWQRSNEYTIVGDGSHIAKKTTASKYSLYRVPVFQQFNLEYDFSTDTYLTPLPWVYTTAWMTLDGNAGNRKEIDRIEFDYQGGTSSVILYYAYSNGLLAGTISYLVAPVQTRFNTYTWNSPIGKQQSNRFYLQLASSGPQTMTTNYILKQIRIYYRNIGNYKTNTLR